MRQPRPGGRSIRLCLPVLAGVGAVFGLVVYLMPLYTAVPRPGPGGAGDRTRAGQPLAEAFALAADVDAVVAVGVNCCAPADADRAVALAAEVTGKPVVGYPNRGERWDAAARGWRGAPAFRPARVTGWRSDHGAKPS